MPYKHTKLQCKTALNLPNNAIQKCNQDIQSAKQIQTMPYEYTMQAIKSSKQYHTNIQCMSMSNLPNKSKYHTKYTMQDIKSLNKSK